VKIHWVRGTAAQIADTVLRDIKSA
jgi:hypothetical protein